MIYPGMIGAHECFSVPEFAEFVLSLSDEESEKPVSEVWKMFLAENAAKEE